MAIRSISATVLFVEDLDKCMKFYRDIVGLEVIPLDAVSLILKLEGQDFLLLKLSAAVEMVGEAALSLGQGAGHRVLLCAGVEDVDATYQAFTAKGLTFIKPPADKAWGRRTAYFADPEGNLWELWQSLEAKPQS